MTEQPRNWAGNVTFSCRRFHQPCSVPDLQRLVADSRRMRVLGTGHSFSPVADTTGDLVSVAGLPTRLELDEQARTVTVSAGTSYGQVASFLAERGWALHNLGSLPHISVAGACATGTHGSGDRNGVLATAARGLELVTAGGDVVRLTAEGDPGDFAGAVVALGALGVVTSLTLDVQPTFAVRQVVYDDLPFDTLLAHFDQVTGAGYSVSLFTTWRRQVVEQVWLKQRLNDVDHDVDHDVDRDHEGDHEGDQRGEGGDEAGGQGSGSRPGDAPEWLGARRADGPRHPIHGMPVEHVTQQLGVPGPWSERLAHFRHELPPSAGDELQSEYLLPRAQAVAALAALSGIREQFAPLLLIGEIRTIAADDLWLSVGFGRDSVGVHFTWVNDQPAVEAVLPIIEASLAPFGARPHWAKVFTTAPDVVRGLLPRLPDFQRLAERYDPDGLFRNDLLDSYLFS